MRSGGYAHVYICTSQVPINDNYKHVLKRIAVQSIDDLREVGNEVEFMVCRCISLKVTYIIVV